MSTAVKLPVTDKRVEDILLWRDPKKSGIALGSALLPLIFLQFVTFSTVAFLISALVVGAVIWRIVSGVTKRPPLPVPRILREGVSEAEVRAFADRTTPIINKALSIGYRLVNGRELLLSGPVALAAYAVSYVAAHVPLLGLAYVLVILSFAVPKVYEMYKTEIDSFFYSAKSKISAFYHNHLEKLVSSIPRSAAVAKPAESSSMKKDE